MPNGNIISTRSARHGVYSADSCEVRDWVTRYYGDVNQSYTALVRFVISITGHGEFDSWNDMEAIDLLIVCAECAKYDSYRLSKYMAEFEATLAAFEITDVVD